MTNRRQIKLPRHRRSQGKGVKDPLPPIEMPPMIKIYRVSPIIRPNCKIRPSVIFEDDFKVSPTLKISPS